MAVIVTPLPDERRELLVDIADVLVRLAVDVLNAAPQGAPSRVRISVGTPVDFCCGAVTVILRRIVPLSAGNGCEPAIWAADWTLDVSRDCPPGLGSVYNILPSPDAVREADTLMMLDAMLIVDRFAQLAQQQVTQRVRQGSAGVPAGCVRFDAGSVSPYVDGECSGWRFDFRTGLVH